LLRCYPPSHRAFHREEMLGVLLATARPGQRTPGLGQTVNLAACGLAIRVRRIPGWLAADAGQDALAIAVAVAVTRVRGPVGRRVAGLMATGLLPSLAVTELSGRRVVPAVFLVPNPLLVSLLAAVLVWPVAIISWRGRAERRRRLAEPDLDFTVVYAEFQAFCSRRRLPASSTPATGAGLGRLAGRAIPTRRDQPMARLRRQPVPATLTTTPCHSAHQGSSGNWTP
jgi:hypothetical protein